MKNNHYFLFISSLLALVLWGCSPDVNPSSNCVDISRPIISPPVTASSYQIFITASPVSSLKDKRVLINDKPVSDAQFIADKGLIVRSPANLSTGIAEIKLEGTDCTTTLAQDLEVYQESDLFNHPDFIPPSSPNFIIPTVPNVFPPSVDNAWLSPQNPDYCLWFVMKKRAITYNGETTYEPTTEIDPSQSFEQKFCNRQAADPNEILYRKNTMSGTLNPDPAVNSIHVWIDRTPTGGIKEEFTGQFIDLNSTPHAYEKFYWCGSNDQIEKTGHLMLLTSVKTGRQLLAFQPVL